MHSLKNSRCVMLCVPWELKRVHNSHIFPHHASSKCRGCSLLMFSSEISWGNAAFYSSEQALVWRFVWLLPTSMIFHDQMMGVKRTNMKYSKATSSLRHDINLIPCFAAPCWVLCAALLHQVQVFWQLYKFEEKKSCVALAVMILRNSRTNMQLPTGPHPQSSHWAITEADLKVVFSPI